MLAPWATAKRHATMTTPLVEVVNIAKDFDVSAPWLDRVLQGTRRQALRAVDGISFAIPRGETLALVGESGCGKSTVARIIVGLHRPSGGHVVFNGQRVLAQSIDPAFRRNVQ